MIIPEFYNRFSDEKQVRSAGRYLLRSALFASLLGAAGCTVPKQVAIGEVCSQPPGTAVAVSGFVSVPRTVDTVQLTRGGRVTDVGYQVLLSGKPTADGDSVKITVWTTNEREANRIRAVTGGFDPSEMVLFSAQGNEIRTGRPVSIVGVTTPDITAGCAVSVEKVEASMPTD